jgi:hypothetical protein
MPLRTPIPRPRIRIATRTRLLLTVLLLALAVPRAATAQEPGTLQGRITDPAGAPVASAVVEVTGRSFRRGATTDAEGRYRVARVPAGTWRVRVRHMAYATVTGTVTTQAGAASTFDLVLRDRTVALDTVMVSARNPAAIRREDTEFRTEISEAALELLPLRPEVRDVVGLTPGARPDHVWGGATAQANRYEIDGLAADHPGEGGDLVAPSMMWIESVEVRGLGAAAEFGNFQGGLVNVVTKSGTNRREGAVRVGIDAGALSASNLQEYDVATEPDSRYDVEAEVRGPLVRDRLFYYLGGQFVRREDLVVNHLRTRQGFHAPDPVQAQEQKAFGKLSWHPRGDTRFVLSGGYLGVEVDRFGSTGYEDGAFVRSTAPTAFYNAELRRVLGAGALFEATLGGISLDERREPYGDPATPGVVLFGLGERPAYRAAAFRHRRAPSSTTGTASLSWAGRTGPLDHQLKIGGEYSAGRWINERLRNGGMTWRPGYGRIYDAFDPENTATWRRDNVVPFTTGGEIRQDADVRNAAVYVQDHIDLGPRVSVSPGLRMGWWSGSLTPADAVGPRINAADDRAIDPRLGLTLDLTGRNDLVVKAHWGRFHQSMFAQLYDRVQGGNVFSNEQTWDYVGTPADPGTTWTPRQLDSMALVGRIKMREQVRLNQTGPIENYRQPYVDQWVLGIEKQLGRWWKAEVVLVDRRNHNMVALLDRNAATNYTLFDSVSVLDAAGNELGFGNDPVMIPGLYLPNDVLVDYLKYMARNGGGSPPPGLAMADTIRLQWDPDYVLTTAPDARRSLQQAQLVLRMGHPRYGGLVSVVYSMLKGNLDNVSGYDDVLAFAGPYVNPNQATNNYGRLSNSSEWEIKAWVYGALGWGVRGGVFWTQSRGDRYSPTVNLSSYYRYSDGQGRLFQQYLLVPVSGQPVFLRQRGSEEYNPRSLVDLHLERPVRLAGAEWTLTADAFNVLGRNTATRYNTIVNGAISPGAPLDPGIEPELVYGAVRERVRPRSLRLGAAVRF